MEWNGKLSTSKYFFEANHMLEKCVIVCVCVCVYMCVILHRGVEKHIQQVECFR